MDFIGKLLPDVELAATDGSLVNPSKLEGFVVIFCYPWTGRPGHSNPPEWDDIPGAHGSTPQAVAYAKSYADFQKRNVQIFGLSFQNTEWQREFAARCKLPFPLLSDARREFSNALGLPIFTAGGEEYLKRLTLIASDSIVQAVRFPIPVPESDAEEVLDDLARRWP
ncbi:MAG: peroxiredoxin [Aestuariivirga sp.]